VDLQEFLVWVFGGGGSIAAAYLLVKYISFLDNLASEPKRYASLAIASVLGGAAFYLSTVLGYVDTPESAKAWIEALFAIAWVVVTGSQAVHGRLDLRE